MSYLSILRSKPGTKKRALLFDGVEAYHALHLAALNVEMINARMANWSTWAKLSGSVKCQSLDSVLHEIEKTAFIEAFCHLLR